MPVRKKYEPHCPASNCGGGYKERLRAITAEGAHLTPEVLKRRKDRSSIYRCSYCGFVWFQKSNSRRGFNPIPAGKWDSPQRPNEFYELPVTFQIREENTSRFWEIYFEKLQRRRLQARKRKLKVRRRR